MMAMVNISVWDSSFQCNQHLRMFPRCQRQSSEMFLWGQIGILKFFKAPELISSEWAI